MRGNCELALCVPVRWAGMHMQTTRSNIVAVVFFGGWFFCVWNPQFLPAREWLNCSLEYALGWCR
jgi:hypothetical protein